MDAKLFIPFLTPRTIYPGEILESWESLQFVVVLNGILQIIGQEHLSSCQSGDTSLLDPQVSYTFQSLEGACFLAFSSDMFLVDGLWGQKMALHNYDVYEVVPGTATQDKWSVAILDIFDSPKHFHRSEKEHFLVIRGSLCIEVDGIFQELMPGEFITICPGQIHKLKSLGIDPVRVVCFSFPAFTPQDMFLVGE